MAHEHLPGDDGGVHAGAVQAEEDVPRQVAGRQRRGRVIVHQDDVGRGAHGQLAERGPQPGKDGAGDARIVRPLHLHHLAGRQGARIAGGLLVDQVGGRHLAEHVVGKAVVAQPHRDADLEHPGHVGGAHGVVHVGARVVDHHGAAVEQDLGLDAVHLDAMGGQGRGPEDARFLQPLHDAQAAAAQGLALVGLVLGHVQVKAGVHLPGQIQAGLEGGFGEGHRGVEAKEGRQAAGRGIAVALAGLDAPDEAHVLAGAGAHGLLAVAVCHLVAQAGPHAGLLDGAGDLVQAAVDAPLAGVVVDERRRAVADGVDQADEGAIVHVVGPQGPVQAPPQLFQDLGKVGGRLARQGHTAGKGAVKVGVGADQPGHHQAAPGVQARDAGIARRQLGAGPQAGDPLALDVEGTVGDDLGLTGLARRAPGHGDQGTVGDQHVPPPLGATHARQASRWNVQRT